MNNIERFTLEEIQQICSQCYSYRQLALRFGYSENSINRVKEIIEQYNLDISHFTGQGWKRDKIDISIFQYNKSVKSEVMIRALTILRGWKCEKCGRTEWEGQKIPLCVHHVDGNHINNQIENLQILCPNCHAQTDNYCGRNKRKRLFITEEQFVEALQNSSSIRQALQKLGINYAAKYYYDKAHKLMDKYQIIQKKKTRDKAKNEIKKRKELNYCVDCRKIIDNRATRCVECEHKRQRHAEWPEKEELKNLIRHNSFSAIGKQFNVSDNTVRKWCKYYGLPYKKREIKAYSDKEWSVI